MYERKLISINVSDILMFIPKLIWGIAGTIFGAIILTVPLILIGRYLTFIDSLVLWVHHSFIRPILTILSFEWIYDYHLIDLENHLEYTLVWIFVILIVFGYIIITTITGFAKEILLPVVVGSGKSVKINFSSSGWLFFPSFKRRYTLTEFEIQKSVGIFSSSKEILPLRAIQAINITRSFTDRIRGKGNLEFSPSNKNSAIKWDDVYMPNMVKESIDDLRNGKIEIVDIARKVDQNPFYYYHKNKELEAERNEQRRLEEEKSKWYFNLVDEDLENFLIVIPPIPAGIFNLIYETKYCPPMYPKSDLNKDVNWVKYGEIIYAYSPSADSMDNSRIIKSLFSLNQKNTTNVVTPFSGVVQLGYGNSANHHWNYETGEPDQLIELNNQGTYSFRIRPLKGENVSNATQKSYQAIIDWSEKYLEKYSWNLKNLRWGVNEESIRAEINALKNFENKKFNINEVNTDNKH
jgi:hypothetical protein